MTRQNLSTLRVLLTLTLASTLLPGCFIFFEEEDDDHEDYEPAPTPPPNAEPEIVSDETWWFCDIDESANEWYFEFQAVVEDWDGAVDVEFVDVTVYDPIDGFTIDGFSLLYEGDAVWGGIVWEFESNLYCGEPVDVVFEAWDYHGGYDSFTLYY